MKGTRYLTDKRRYLVPFKFSQESFLNIFEVLFEKAGCYTFDRKEKGGE